MVANKYRWDFIGLSTDEKPTPANSDKVVDGSTFYCSDTSKLYVFCKDTWYEKTATGGGGTTYTAGDNITITDGVISATDTTYSAFTGTDGSAAGTAGLVPAPSTTDAGKFLKADGTWDTAGGGGGPTVVQTIGASTTDVMSQKAVTDGLYPQYSAHTKGVIGIGNYASIIDYGDSKVGIGKVNLGANSAYALAINGGDSTGTVNAVSGMGIWAGSGGSVTGPSGIAIGSSASVTGKGGVAIGRGSSATSQGELNIGTTESGYGYNNTNYRLITGVHDGQLAHDAVTVEQVNALIDAINTALSVNIPHIGATS